MTFIEPGGLVLWGQIWAIGYSIAIVAIIVGLAVVARPSGRKAWKK